jgi:hypothetical protein
MIPTAIQRRKNIRVIIQRLTKGRRLYWIIALGVLVLLAELVWLWVRQPAPGAPLGNKGQTSLNGGSPSGSFPEFSAPSRIAVSDGEAETARTLNEALAITPGAVIAAQPFLFDGRLPSLDRLRARDCLAATIHYEAASEPLAGQRAVAQVVLNRVRHPAFPNSVCGVVFQGSQRTTGCQFTFTCDGSLRRIPSAAAWRRSLQIADEALAGVIAPEVGTATHYHADWVAPYWRTSLTKLATIGAHIFYTWRGNPGQRRAFSVPYRGGELDYRQALALAVNPTFQPITVDPLDPLGNFSGALTPTLQRQDTPASLPSPVQADQKNGKLAADDGASGLAADRGVGTLKR